MSARTLYLVRHAVAAERGDEWPDDAKRPLTDAGIDRMQLAARGLARLGVDLGIVLTSPYMRARQTAEILAAAFATAPRIVTIASLKPGAAYDGLLKDLDRHARGNGTALIGHEPGLGEVAGRLAGISHGLEFKKGAVCRIDVAAIPPSGPGHLRWFMTARTLGMIKKRD